MRGIIMLVMRDARFNFFFMFTQMDMNANKSCLVMIPATVQSFSQMTGMWRRFMRRNWSRHFCSGSFSLTVKGLATMYGLISIYFGPYLRFIVANSSELMSSTDEWKSTLKSLQVNSLTGCLISGSPPSY